MADKLTMEQAGKLLHLLSTDDAFRASFASNPAAAIQSATGADISSHSACYAINNLASKQQIAADRVLLFGRLTSPLQDTVHELNAL